MSLLRLPLAGLKLSLLTLPLVATVFTISDTLAAACILLMWGGTQMTRALADGSGEGIVSDTLLLGVVAVKTLQILQLSNGDASRDPIWLAPVAMALLLHSFLNLTESEPPSKQVIYRYNTLNVLSLGASLLAINIELNELALTLADSLVTLLFLVSLVQWRGPAGWAGGSDALLSYFFVQGCMIPLSDDKLYRSLMLVIAVLLSVSAKVRVEPLPRPPFFVAVRTLLGEILTMPVDLVGRLVSSVLPYQILMLASFSVLVVSILSDEAWYETKVTFPPAVRRFCVLSLDVVDLIIKPWFRFTNQADFQNTILLALPELASLRSSIFRILAPVHLPLTQCKDGKVFLFFPGEDLLGVISLLPQAAMALATFAQVFPEGGVFVRNRWFWAVGAVSGMASLVVMHLTADASTVFWYLILDKSTYLRRYTMTGQYALVAQLVFCGASLGMFVVTSQIKSIEQRLLERSRPPEEAAPGIRVYARQLFRFLTAPNLVLMLVAAFMLAVVIGSTGSPVQKFEVTKVVVTKPDWLISTPNDKIAALGIGSLSVMLNPKARIAALVVALTKYALEQLGCWGCLCLPIPSLGELKGFGNDVANGFKSIGRALGFRRLLEHKLDSTNLGSRSVSRVLLATERCPKQSCSKTQICVSDVVSDIVEQLVKIAQIGPKFAMDLVVEQILKRIPNFGVIDSLMKELHKLDDLIDFELLDLPDVDFSFQTRWLTFDIGFLMLFQLPSLPTPGTVTLDSLLIAAALFVIAAVVVYQLGLLVPLVKSTWLAFQLSAACILLSGVAGATVFVMLIRQQIRLEGYQDKITWGGNAYLYAIVLGLMLLSLVLTVGEQQDELLTLLRKKVAEPEEKIKLLPSQRGSRRP